MMEYARLQPDDTARVERIRKAVKAYMDYKITITKAEPRRLFLLLNFMSIARIQSVQINNM